MPREESGLALAPLTPLALELGAEPRVEWGDLRGITLSEPFFDDTVERWARTAPRPRRLRTGVDALAVLDHEPAFDPAVLIFHMSRCGSTLVSRLLASHPTTLVISEPAALNTLLLAADRSAERHALWLRRLVRALGRAHGADSRTFVLKLSSWNVTRIDLFRRAFPAAALVWLQRRPQEVVSSLVAQEPGWLDLRQSPRLAERILGVPAAVAATLDAEEFCVRALRAMLEAARTVRDAGALVVDYSELPTAIWERVAPFAGIAIDDADAARMRDASRFHAKDTSGRVFTGDSIRPVSDRVRALVDALVEPLYRTV